MSWIKDIKQEVAELDQSKIELRKFSHVMAIGLVVIAILGIWLKHRFGVTAWVLVTLAAFFAIFGLIAPQILKGIHKGWMTFSFVLGWFMSRLILSAVFFIILTPIGLLMRLFGKRPLLLRTEAGRESYWIDRAKKPASYEKMY